MGRRRRNGGGGRERGSWCCVQETTELKMVRQTELKLCPFDAFYKKCKICKPLTEISYIYICECHLILLPRCFFGHQCGGPAENAFAKSLGQVPASFGLLYSHVPSGEDRLPRKQQKSELSQGQETMDMESTLVETSRVYHGMQTLRTRPRI